MQNLEKGTSYAIQLFSAMDRMRRVWQGISPCPELSKSQFGTLMAISHGGKLPHAACREAQPAPVPLSVVASQMGQSLPSVSQRVSTLEQMGYIERVPDPHDRRVSGVRLTEGGRELLARACQTVQAELDTALAKLGADQLQTLFRLLGQLTDELEKITKNK